MIEFILKHLDASYWWFTLFLEKKHSGRWGNSSANHLINSQQVCGINKLNTKELYIIKNIKRKAKHTSHSYHGWVLEAKLGKKNIFTMLRIVAIDTTTRMF